MQEEIGGVVLRCPHCSKPFDKQSTLKRHGYYCRSRRVGITPRSRSCVCCAKAKARCDNKQPKCSRCATKGTKCDYPANVAPTPRSATHQQSNSPAEDQSSDPSSAAITPDDEYQRNERFGDGMDVDDVLVAVDQRLATDTSRLFDWDDSNAALTELTERPTSNKAFLFEIPQFSQFEFDQTLLDKQLSYSPPSIPPTISDARRSIVPRPAKHSATKRVAELLMHTLKSYLVMMRRNILPPFIHPRSLSPSLDNGHTEALDNCISLMHMVNSESRGSRKLFWTNVRMECERFYEESTFLSRWQLLHAMQALSIYMLMRLDEGETDHNNIDSLLVSTVTVIAKQFGLSYMAHTTQSDFHQYGVHSNWDDWIFEESKRRLCGIYQFVNLVVYFEPAALCEHPSDLFVGPLPAKKQLWEAANEIEWSRETQKDPRAHAAYGLAASGDLVELGLDDEGRHCSDMNHLHYGINGKRFRPAANWEEWCSGMDSMGGLVMLAASLMS